MKKQLHPGALWMWRISSYSFWIFFLIIISMTLYTNTTLNSTTNIIIIVALTILWIILVEVLNRMSYNRWFYDFTDTNLKLERGIIWKKYSNIPYERIQNVDITRGIIARMLGFSTLNIQTAGYSMSTGSGRGMHSEGYIPAVNVKEAEQIRDFLMKKIGKKQGL